MPRPIGLSPSRRIRTIEDALGIVVKELRVKRGLSQAALADKLGYTVSFISKLERGEMNVTLRSLFDLAGALETDAEILVKRARRHWDLPTRL